MKAHKKIIIWTFVLSVLFFIETLLLYLFGANESPNYYIWIENVSIGILTGVMVSFIVEVGNYLSLKNKLYEKLFSECIVYYNFLNEHIRFLEQTMNSIDINLEISNIKNQIGNHVSKVSNMVELIITGYTKCGDFTFLFSLNDKGKISKSVKNSINSFSNITTLSKELINSYNAVFAGNYIHCYNILLTSYKNSIRMKKELDLCVREMEHYHKFSKSWDSALNIINDMNENTNVENNISKFENSAYKKNTMLQINSAMDMISQLQNCKTSKKNDSKKDNSKLTKKDKDNR